MTGDTLVARHRDLLLSENDYLRALPGQLANRLVADLRLVEFRQGQIIESATADTLVVFPLTAVFLFTLAPTGTQSSYTWIASCRNAIFGRRGDWEESMPYQLRTLRGGFALVIDKTACVAHPGKDHWSKFYNFHGAGWALRSFGNHATCLGTHVAAQRLATVLLEAAAAFGQDRPILITQSQLAVWLSIRRESVSAALAALVADKAIIMGRAQIKVTDADRLRQKACGCRPFNESTWADLLKGWYQVWAEALMSSPSG